MVIVDTTVWVDYLRVTQTPQTEWLGQEIDGQRLGLTDLNLCEVLQGVRDEREAVKVRRQLLKFEVWGTGGVELATAAVRNYRTLQSRGIAIRRTIDCLIATYYLTHDHALLHSDRDFVPLEQLLGLRAVHA